MLKRIHCHRPRCRLSRQRGSALIIALVFLLVMTLIGITAMQGTTQQERMAGNYLDRMLAFQAAEGALSVARRTPQPALPNPLATPAWQQTVNWWDTDPRSVAVPGYTDLTVLPRHVTERLPGPSESSGVGFAGGGSTFVCRYTARSSGGTLSAVVILEETGDCI